MTVETRKKGSGEKGKVYSRLCCCCSKTCWQMSVCPHVTVALQNNVCKKLFSDSRVHNDEESVVAQQRASFMEALVRIHDCHI
jgi:hypothetical protein